MMHSRHYSQDSGWVLLMLNLSGVCINLSGVCVVVYWIKSTVHIILGGVFPISGGVWSVGVLVNRVYCAIEKSVQMFKWVSI